MPQAQALRMIQDKQGFLWVGTYSGLARFNGEQWKVFTKEDGLPRNSVSAVFEDRDGIMAGLIKGGVAVLGDAGFKTLERFSFISEFRVSDIRRAGETLWLATSGGVAFSGEDGQGLLTVEHGLPSQLVFGLYTSENGSVWAGTSHGLARVASGPEGGFVAETYLPGVQVRVVLESWTGQLILGTNQGLYILEEDKVLPYLLEGEHFSKKILCAAFDQNGYLWVGTEEFGVVGFEEYDPTIIDRSSGLANNRVNSILADSDGNIWMGTDVKLVRYSAGPFTVFNTDHGLPHAFVRAIYRTPTGDLWFGTRSGISHMKPGQPMAVLPEFDGMKVDGIGGHPDGRVFAATQTQGLQIYREGEALKAIPFEGQLFSVFVDTQNRVWVGGSGLMELREESLVPILSHEILDRANILQMAEGPHGWLWLASTKGLLAFDPVSHEVQTFSEVSDISVWSVAVDSRGQIWAGTNGKGLFIHDGFGFKQLSTTTKPALANDTVWQLLYTSAGEIWAGHNMGLDRIRNDEIVRYTISDGLAGNEGSATASAEDRGGNLWFGTFEGVTRYHPTRESQVARSPEIYIDEIKIDGRRLSQGNQLMMPRRGQIEITYSGVFLSGGMRYRALLEGPDHIRDSGLTDSTTVKYYHLGPGNYTFKVLARNEYGLWSEPGQQFTFTVEPAIWERPLSWLMGLFVIAGVSWLLSWQHARALIRKQKELEELVNQKTRALRGANDDLREAQEKLVSAAHGAGMAETAIRILHNVGNSLNSVNVSIAVLADMVDRNREARVLEGLLDLLRPHKGDFNSFIRDDPRGRQVPSAFFTLLEHMHKNRKKFNKEVASLHEQVEQITAFIKEQEVYAELGGFVEPIDPALLIRDALRIEREHFEAHQIEVQFNAGDVPLLQAAKVKLVMVLINLFRNAVDALKASPPGYKRRIWVDLNRALDGGTVIRVRDNGPGVEHSQREKIFFHGYTTKTDRPGFGLHFVANSMTEMGGEVRLEMEAEETGASFVLWFPESEPHPEITEGNRVDEEKDVPVMPRFDSD